MTRRILLTFSIFVFALTCFPIFASVTAEVYNTNVAPGEGVQLVIKVEDNDAKPNLSELRKTFQILGTSQSQQVSIVNGKMRKFKTWIYSLIVPMDATGKTINIPAIQVGNEKTKPIILSLGEFSIQSNNVGAKPIFIKGDLINKQGYVQQQFIYSIKLYMTPEMAERIRQGNISAPNMPDAVIKALVETPTYQKRLNGQLYYVLERNFAIFPQKSGRLQIPAITFSAQAVTEQKHQKNDPFAMMGSPFFVSTKPIRLTVPAHDLEVRPIPAGVDGNWLPAEDFTLSESWSKSVAQAKVGDLITRTVKVNARGLTAAQLPVLADEKVNNFKVYPNKPQLKDNSISNDVEGESIEKIGYMPTQSGEHTLPGITVEWYNTEKGQLEKVFLPPKTIHVAPGVITPSPADIAPEVSSTQGEIQNLSKQFVKPEVNYIVKVVELPFYKNLWFWISVFLLLLWLATIFIRLGRRKGKESSMTDSQTVVNLKVDKQVVKALFKKINLNCRHKEAIAAQVNIVSLTQALMPGVSCHSLGQVINLVEDELLKQSLEGLQRHLYHQEKKEWQPGQLSTMLEAWGTALLNLRNNQNNNALKPLYPK